MVCSLITVVVSVLFLFVAAFVFDTVFLLICLGLRKATVQQPNIHHKNKHPLTIYNKTWHS